MKITLIGGSRGTGAKVAELAQRSGHEVTILSRSIPESPDKPQLRTIMGDALDPKTATQAVAGADAVVITVGGAKGAAKHRTAVTESVIAAMQQTGAKRLIVQSSLGAGGSASQLPGVIGFITKLLLANPLADHETQEQAVIRSGLEWTIMRPTGLTNKEPSGNWQHLEIGQRGKLKGSIARGDVAGCILAALGDDSSIGKAFGISSR